MKLDDVIQQPGQTERIQQLSTISKIHVSMPCRVVSYDGARRCVDVQPLIRALGSSEIPPVLMNVPVWFPGRYSYAVNVGDECLVVFADRCIDAWWQSGEVSNPLTARNHDLSDGIAFVGIKSLPKVGDEINLDEFLEELRREATGNKGMSLFINGDGCLIFEKADGSAYINDRGEVIYEEIPDENISFSLNSDGELIMEVS